MDTADYRALCAGKIDNNAAGRLTPDRNTLSMVWRYLAAAPGGSLQETPACLLRKIVRWTGAPLQLGKLLTCLDIFADVGLLKIRRLHKHITIELMQSQGKADLSQSATMQKLMKE